MATNKKKLVIAIDGPGGVGKSTVARLAAQRLGIQYINTGAMYRAVALAARDEGIDVQDDKAVQGFCSRLCIAYDPEKETISVNNRDYTGEIKEESAGALASVASQKRPVRELLVRLQREFGAKKPAVMEGRDIGTVVFPDAVVKIFLDALPEIRAQRRSLEMKDAPAGAETTVLTGIRERDARDMGRDASPLKAANDAIRIDTGGLDINGVLERVLMEIKKKTGWA
ncbi:MAG: (d)CMP kinase [Deltaproteobacteria bacterium]